MQALYEERHFLGLTVSEHPLALLRPLLKKRGYVSARDLRGLPAGRYVKLAGEVVIVHTPPMRNAKRVIFTTIEDETGLVDLAVFPRHQQGNTRVILANPLILVEGRLNRRGINDVAVAVHRVRPAPLELPGKNRAAPRGE